MNDIEILKNWIDTSHTLVVLTGAGISTPSGIPDFRSNNDIPFENILTYGYMVDHPTEFWEYCIKYLYHPNAKPNDAHYFLAELEKSGKLNSIITQNIDDLHQLAGSKKVYPLHGSINTCTCMECDKKYKMIDLNLNNPNYCSCGGFIRPDITLYTECLDDAYYHMALVASQIADMIIVIGSSLTVNPAASLLRYYAGHRLVIINKSETPYDKYADLIIREDIIDTILKLKSIKNS